MNNDQADEEELNFEEIIQREVVTLNKKVKQEISSEITEEVDRDKKREVKDKVMKQIKDEIADRAVTKIIQEFKRDFSWEYKEVKNEGLTQKYFKHTEEEKLFGKFDEAARDKHHFTSIPNMKNFSKTAPVHFKSWRKPLVNEYRDFWLMKHSSLLNTPNINNTKDKILEFGKKVEKHNEQWENFTELDINQKKDNEHIQSMKQRKEECLNILRKDDERI